MVKIFSIKEIIDASNTLLESKKEKQNFKKPEIKKNHSQKNKLVKHENPLILKDVNNDKTIALKLKKNSSENFDKIKKFSKIDLFNTNKKNFYSVEENKEISNNKRIIDQIYILLKKKIRKNTLKIILDLQLEINSLKENLTEFRKRDLSNLKINKRLKEEISTLLNNEKILNFKFNEFKKKLINADEKQEETLKINLELKDQIAELKNSNNNIKNINNQLLNNQKILQEQIDKFIVNEKNLIDSNKNVENNILILTKSKNLLNSELKKLKSEFDLIDQNKNILLQNNQKIQKEISLLTKNKSILIDLNEKYQKQINLLNKDKEKLQEEKIDIEKNLDVLIDDKQKLIENNNKFKDEISVLSINEEELLRNKRSLQYEINSLKNREVVDLNKNENSQLEKMNTNLQYELSSLRASEKKLIENNKEMHAELIKLRSTNNNKVSENELKRLRENLVFHQDENLRLSHELSESKKRYDIMKNQLTNIEVEKGNISKKIQDLTNSIANTNIVETTFTEKKPKEIKKKKVSNSDIDINEEIKNIFTKI